MGRGDKKTKKGKRFAGSYGKVRVRKEKTGQNFVKPKAKKEEELEVVVEKKDVPKKKTSSKKTTTKKKSTKKEKQSLYKNQVEGQFLWS